MEQWSIQARIKKSIKEGIPESELHVIEFKSADDIPWTRVDKEFKLGDRFFDVVHTDPANALRFSCVNDVEESILFAELDQRVQNEVNDDQPFQRTSKVFTQMHYYFEKHDVSIVDFLLFSETKEVPIDSIRDNYLSKFLSINSPPPQA